MSEIVPVVDVPDHRNVVDLPVQLTSFVGRGAELTELVELLEEKRLVTLAGPGGCGKTRLAVAAAGEAAERWPDGVRWVDLGQLTDQGLVSRAVAAAARVLVNPTGDPEQALVAQLRNRRLLLCLDTCEHRLAPCAELVHLLLRGCPGVSVLATSREPLGVPGEAVWRVPPLELHDAAQLFAERAMLVRSDYTGGGPAERAICERLDGIPLAVELAAAWVGVLTPVDIAARLGSRLAFLTGGARLAADRHRSLAASLAWSVDLLDEPERVLFRRAAVFAGGFDVEAASAVCADGMDVLDSVRRLVDKSLLTPVNAAPGARFRMLDTVRDYAADCLDLAGETGELRDRHLDHYLAFAREAEVGLERDQDRWRISLETEHDNLRAAVSWGLDASDPERGRQLAAALARFWFVCGHTEEGVGFLQRAVALGVDDRTPLQAALLSGAAAMAAGSGRPGQVADFAERGLEIAAAVGDHRHRGRCLAWIAYRWFFVDFTTCHEMAGVAARWGALADDPFVVDTSAVLRARSFSNRDRHSEAVAEIRGVGDRAQARGERGAAAFALGIEVWAALFTGDVREATERGREALALAEPLGDHFTVGHMTSNLAWATALSGDVEGARALIDPVMRSVTDADPELLRWLALVPGRLELWRGDLAAARHWLVIASRFAAPVTDNYHVAQVLPALAGTLRRLGRIDEASEVADRAAELAGSLDVPHARAEALDELGHLARQSGRRAEAMQLHHRALDVRIEHDLRTFWPDSLDAIAGVGDDPETSVRLHAAAASGRIAVGRDLLPVDRAPHHATMTGLRAALDPDVFGGAWQAGAQMTLDEAAAYVTRSHRGRRQSASGWESLTRAELQVVELVVAGRSNPEIGARLFMSRSTVKTHLGHVYAKLGVANRAELAAAAARRQA